MKVLVSYHYYKGVDLDDELGSFATPIEATFADSGGFSAWTKGAVIRTDEYAAWVHRWSHRFTWHANLDVIGSPEGTWRNQIVLEKRHGLTPLPVFHVGEPWVFLDKYLDRGHPYICLGGMVGRPAPQALQWAARCFQRARDGGFKTVFHGFGQTRRRIADNLPWYSIDSSSWGSGQRYGIVMLWDDGAARFRTARMGKADAHRWGRLIRDHGTDPRELSGGQFNHTVAARTSAVAWLRYADWLRRRYQVPLVGAEDGPHLYLAGSGGDFEQPRLGGLRVPGWTDADPTPEPSTT